MERMDADGGQYIRADPSRSVFYSREFRVIARAGRKVSHLLDGRSHRYTCSHFSWSEGILPSETRRGRDARAPRVSPAIDALINTAAMGRPRSHRTPALPRDARASSEGILPSETRRGRDARAPRGCPRAQGVTPYRIFWKPLHVICPFRHQDTQTPPSPLVGLGNAYRGRFLGKPLRVIYRFRHQDAQSPPSPLVGEGGRGDEGQKRAGMQNITHLSQEIYLERGVTPGLNGRWGNRHAARCTESGIDQNDESRYNVKEPSLCIRSPGHAYITNQQHPSGRAQPVVARHVYWFRRLHVLTGNPFRGEPSPP